MIIILERREYYSAPCTMEKVWGVAEKDPKIELVVIQSYDNLRTDMVVTSPCLTTVIELQNCCLPRF